MSHWVDVADSHGLQRQCQRFQENDESPWHMVGTAGRQAGGMSPAIHVLRLHWGRSSCEVHVQCLSSCDAYASHSLDTMALARCYEFIEQQQM